MNASREDLKGTVEQWAEHIGVKVQRNSSASACSENGHLFQ